MTKSKQFLFKLTLLSMSLLLTSATAISMTIPMIQESFPHISQTTIESLVTIPSFTMMVFVLLSGYISEKIGSKNTVMLGLLLSLIGGVVPLFTTSFRMIYLARFVFGAGLGCYNSLAVSLINDFYEGDEKQTLIGFQSATQSLGSSFATFLAGLLASINWHYAFAVYLLALPILLMVYFVIPDTKAVQSSVEKQKQRLNLSTVWYALGLFSLLAIVMVVFTKVGSLVSERNIAQANLLGMALSLMTLAGFFSGLLYGRVYKLFHQFTPVVGGVVSTISFVLLSMATNMYAVTLYLILIGFCLSLFIPYIFGALLETAPKGSETLAVSIGMVGSNLGSFASPFIVSFVTGIFGDNSASFSLLVAGVGFCLLTLIFLIDILRKNQSAVSAQD